MCNFGHISVFSAPSGRGAQGRLAHPACLDYRSRHPKELFWKRNLLAPRSSSSRPRAVERRVALLTPLTWITVLDMLPHPSVNGTSEEFISTCGVRVCVCVVGLSLSRSISTSILFRAVTSAPSGRGVTPEVTQWFMQHCVVNQDEDISVT